MDHPEQHSEISRGTPAFTLLRVGVALLLLVAATLKSVQLVQGPVGEGWLQGRIGTAVAVGGEVFLALWLLSGAYAMVARGMALALFLLFTGISGMAIATGQESCGCFGSLPVDPRFTFAMDIVVIVALVICPVRSRPHPPRVGIVVSCGLVGLATSLGLLWVSLPNQSDIGEVHRSGLVVLRPETWEGQAFPLIPHIEGIDGLHHGEWLVILFHRDCPECRRLLSRTDWSSLTTDENVQVAFVEVPGSAQLFVAPQQNPPGTRFGRLRADRDWFVQTPLLVQVREGIVIALPQVDP